MVPKARPVSTDVGSTNPNFSDLMDEFIQERLRAKGTSVSIAHTHTHKYWQKHLCLKKKPSPLHTLRVAAAAAREVWRFPGTCRSSWRRVTAPGRGPQMNFVRSMTRAFLRNGPRLQVPVALMSSAQTASRTPSMPSSTPPASLTVRNNFSVQTRDAAVFPTVRDAPQFLGCSFDISIEKYSG